MKHINLDYLCRTCGAWLMIAAAPIVAAQTPTGEHAPGGASTAAATAAPSADQVSYLFGLTFAEQLRSVGISDQLTAEGMTRGLKDGLQGKKSNPADRQQLQEYVHSAMDGAVARNRTAAKEFLAHNAAEKGITTTPSGLQYKVIAAGDRKAAAIKPSDEVTVQYRGKLIDGSEFDSSYAHGAPASFTVNGVIKGWQEALLLMKPGAKWQLFVPPELAYDANPKPGIPGGSLLIFDVDLLNVKAPLGTTVPVMPNMPGPSKAPGTSKVPAVPPRSKSN